MFEFTRPSQEMQEHFASVPSAFVIDAIKKIGLKSDSLYMTDIQAVVPSRIPKGKTYVGPAITFLMAPHTATLPYDEFPYTVGTRIHYLIAEEYGQPGDFLVASTQDTKLGVWGGYMSERSAQIGLGGFVTDGYIRDRYQCEEFDVPLFARGHTMIAYPFFLNPVAEMVPVNCGGALVKPGDLLVADDDGVVVVPSERMDDVARALQTEIEAEKQIKEALANGKGFDYIYRVNHPMKYKPTEDEMSAAPDPEQL